MRCFLVLAATLFLFLSFKNVESDIQIIGKWELVSVFEDSLDVTSTHDPFDERYIRFFSNGKFESDGRPFEFNTGTWSYISSNEILELKSVVENDDSAWKVRIQDDRMEWKGVGNEWKSSFLLCFRRIE